jgi:hypothetical protein
MSMTAEQIAEWSDKLRDIAAQGLQYAQNIYDHEHIRDSFRVWRGKARAHFDS